LSGNDPVIVLTEGLVPEQIDLLAPYLWQNPQEYLWDLHDYANPTPPWNSVDADGNGKADDAYGWNFPASSPNIVIPADGHNQWITSEVYNDALLPGSSLPGNPASHVKIMFVIGAANLSSSSLALQYILDQKERGANIVAIGEGIINGDDLGAHQLAEAGILVFRRISNSNINMDNFPLPPTDLFYRATPRKDVEAAALANVIPVTTDPGAPGTAHGVNSFYFAAPGTAAQSWASPVAAGIAGIAAAAYQQAHGGATPTWQQIKRAMMSGVDYYAALDGRTITHDFVDGLRVNGGLLNISNVIAATNTDAPAVTSVTLTSMGLTNPFGTTAQFLLSATGNVSDYTINWGDNTPSAVIDGSISPLPPVFHTYPVTATTHRYFPTIYATSATNGQVYLASAEAEAQAQVTIEPFAPSSGRDDWTLSRSGSDLSVTLTNSAVGTLSRTFSIGTYSSLPLALGQGGDTLTINFSGGNPLQGNNVSVSALAGAANRVNLVGSAGNDAIAVGSDNGDGTRTITVNGG
jgi:hypothetical protein